MTNTEAVIVQQEIQKLCEQRGLWYKVEHECKPDLKMIRIEISVKVEGK